ncbi:hypothetical protein [Microbispora sp. NPDC049125]|uniref:hypothetical protein n=1 Tax=Microbispora sp. NPDC049125 TaxID=3154929 RepID=UPI003466284E
MNAQTVALIAVAAVVVIYRQMMTRPTERRGVLYISAALVVYGLLGGGLFDPAHLALSVVLVVAEIALAVIFGFVRAGTVRVWRDQAGVTWSQASVWTLVAWLASLASRVVLFVAGRAAGVESAPATVLVFVGVTIAAQSLLVIRRGRALPGSAVRPSGRAGVAS